MAKDFEIPADMTLAAIVGFGFPKTKILGKKSRKPLEEVAYLEKFGSSLNL
jgi:hypothetical protein